MPKPFAALDFPTAAELNRMAYAYDRSTAAVDVVSSTTETTIYTKAVAAGAMSTDRMLRCTVIGDYLSNSGSPTLTTRIKFGGTTIHSLALANSTASATRRPYMLRFHLVNLAATNSQFLFGEFDPFNGASQTVDTTGRFAIRGLTVDTTAACTLEVTVQHSASSANISLRKDYALLELI